MDAPDLLPAGSMYRQQPLPDTDPDCFFACETLVSREPMPDGSQLRIPR
jgi:hypothetical protein